MFRNNLLSRLAATAMSCVALAASATFQLVHAEDLCSVTPYTYSAAKTTFPQLTTAINTLEKYAIASWFTDRILSADRASLMSNMLSQCSEDTRLSIVVYGLPNKDCSAGFSSGGSVSSTSDYKTFLKELTDAVGERKVLYVVEPDAVGLLAEDGGCGSSNNYLGNLKVAVAALSENPNAQLYLDVGYWMLAYESNALKVGSVMTEIATAGRVKGVTINTSNYRSNAECASYCSNFQKVMGNDDMHCIVDTSRNYNGSPTTDWCNVATAGIGKPPTSVTGYSNLDYFMWIKVPGESDGQCSTGTVAGPAAGSFFYEGFKLLWDQGYFVKELGISTIDGSTTSTSTTTTITVTVAPTTAAPSASPTTEAPVTETPSTEAPATTAPSTIIITTTEAPVSTASITTINTEAPAPVSTASITTTTPVTTAAETVAPVTNSWTNAPASTSSPTTNAPDTEAPTTVTTATATVETVAPVTSTPTDKATSSTYTTQGPSACRAKRRRIRTL